jgi:glycosyltransferase involved in cell wall biosynthesis
MKSYERLTVDNVEVIPYGFDFEALDSTEADGRRIREELRLGSSFVIGCVGRFARNKGHVYLLNALRDLVRQIPKLHLLLLGSGDPKTVQEMVQKLELESYVTIAGYRKDVPACMKAMDLLVHPTLSESFGQVLVESMNVGTAVIATRIGGVPEIITDYSTGRLVPAADAGAIVNAVMELYQDQSMRERLARAGQASVRQRFTAERMINQQADCYRRLLSASRRGEKTHVASQI